MRIKKGGKWYALSVSWFPQIVTIGAIIATWERFKTLKNFWIRNKLKMIYNVWKRELEYPYSFWRIV